MPGRRFTYSQLYQSATVERGVSSPDPRVTSMPLDCSISRQSHPLQPDQSRMEDLRKVRSCDGGPLRVTYMLLRTCYVHAVMYVLRTCCYVRVTYMLLCTCYVHAVMYVLRTCCYVRVPYILRIRIRNEKLYCLYCLRFFKQGMCFCAIGA